MENTTHGITSITGILCGILTLSVKHELAKHMQAIIRPQSKHVYSTGK